MVEEVARTSTRGSVSQSDRACGSTRDTGGLKIEKGHGTVTGERVEGVATILNLIMAQFEQATQALRDERRVHRGGEIR